MPLRGTTKVFEICSRLVSWGQAGGASPPMFVQGAVTTRHSLFAIRPARKGRCWSPVRGEILMAVRGQALGLRISHMFSGGYQGTVDINISPVPLFSVAAP
jgi:hypothetical protein